MERLGVHFHRKTENISEWDMKEEIIELLSEETLGKIDLLNIGGGIPVAYKNYEAVTLPYIFGKIKEFRKWANGLGIKVISEPGRFIAAPCVELECTVTSADGSTLFVNCSVFNASMDTIVDNIKLLSRTS